MNFLGKLASAFSDKVVTPKIEDFAAQVIDTKIVDKQIERNVIDCFLSKYKNEPFYCDLDGYITRNCVVLNLIASARGNSTIQSNNKTAFASNNIKYFLECCPAYKQKKVQCSKVYNVFEWMFDYTFSSINHLSPHSDLGKLQNDLHRSETESEYRDNRNYMLQLDTVKKMDSMLSIMQESKGVCDDIKPELAECSEEIEKFKIEIKEIESKYQSQNLFDDALLNYYELLQTIAAKLHGQPQTQIDALICTLNCNIALCQSNLCENEKAFKSLDMIDESLARENKCYHFVYAAIILNSADKFMYGMAKQHIDKALKIDPQYHRAFILNQHLNALMECMDCSSNIGALDAHFFPIVEEKKDLQLIADYFMNRGLIFLSYNNPNSAIPNFEQAIKYGYDKTIAKFNLLAAEYAQAIESLPKDVRVLFPSIDYCKMNSVISGLKEIILDSNIKTQPYLSVKERAVTLYASACALTRAHHDLVPLKEYLPLSHDDETTRALILGSNEELSENMISRLQKSDQLFLHFRKLLYNDDLITCKKELVEMVSTSIKDMSAPLFHLLLQSCIALKSPKDFWKYEKPAAASGVTGVPILALEACAYELDGNIKKAKEIFDTIAETSNDYDVLENVIRFYKRNNFPSECEALYIRIEGIYKSSGIFIDDVDMFYSGAINFFISQQSYLAEDFLSNAEASNISAETLCKLRAMLYSTINDTEKLKGSLSQLIIISNSFQNGFNLALCQCRLMDYDASLETCFSLLQDSTSEKNQAKIYWLISDLYLLKENKDDSYAWANKAHNLMLQNPYDQSHQALFGRAIRCGHQEVFSTILAYKQKHPVVLDWLQPVSVDLNAQNPIESLTKAIDDKFPDSKYYVEQEKDIESTYRNGIFPINLLLRNYCGEWWKLFQFAAKNKLKISTGDRSKMQAEQSLIKEDLIVDALTLIILSYFECLPAVQNIKHVHITFGSIAEVQYCYLSWDHPCIINLMRWIETASNIELEADGFIDDDAVLTEAFSGNFIASCNFAQMQKIPYLFADAAATILQAIPNAGILPDVSFVSIPSICNCYGQSHPKEREEMVYRLLTGGTFVSFSADTIIEQISNNDFNVTEELMHPFLICKSDYDMKSFSDVYLQALYRLQTLHPESADSFAIIILKDAERVWRRGTYYRDTANKYSSKESQARSTAISSYVAQIVNGIKKIKSPYPPFAISFLCDQLQKAVTT